MSDSKYLKTIQLLIKVGASPELIMKVIALMNQSKKPLNRGEILYKKSELLLGQDVSPKDLVPDEVGCAESVCNVIRRVYPDFPIITGTWTLWDYLQRYHTRVTRPSRGDIIISPTGTSSLRGVQGHVGIYGERIHSNNSKTGRWDNNYNLTSWRKYYGDKLKFPVYFYQL